MNKDPFISVIMPVFNEEKYLRGAIQSILNQSYTKFELLLLNDASDDNTESIIHKINDERIRYYKSKKRKGIVYQLNKGLELSRGSIIARMDADDISNLTRFDKQIDYLNNHLDIQIVGSNINIIDESGKKIVERVYPENHIDIEYQMPIATSLAHPTIMYRKEIITKVGPYNRNYDLIEDRELFLRMLRLDIKMYNIQEPLLSYRENDMHKNHRRMEPDINNKSIQLGKEYLESKVNEMSDFDYKFRMGLLYYYKGKINESRKYFRSSIKLSYFLRLKAWRYLLLSLLGDSFFNKFRKNGLLSRINYSIKNNLNLQTDLILKK